MNSKLPHLLVGLGLVLSPAACGSESSSGLNVNKLVTELDETETKSLCEFLKSELSSINEDTITNLVCYGGAAIAEASNAIESCEESATSCMNSANDETSSIGIPEGIELTDEFNGDAQQEQETPDFSCEGEEFDKEFKKLSDSCSVSVGDLEQCFRDLAQGINNLTNNISCNTDFEEVSAGLSPDSCKAIEKKCPIAEEYASPSVGQEDSLAVPASDSSFDSTDTDNNGIPDEFEELIP